MSERSGPGRSDGGIGEPGGGVVGAMLQPVGCGAVSASSGPAMEYGAGGEQMGHRRENDSQEPRGVEDHGDRGRVR